MNRQAATWLNGLQPVCSAGPCWHLERWTINLLLLLLSLLLVLLSLLLVLLSLLSLSLFFFLCCFLPPGKVTKQFVVFVFAFVISLFWYLSSYCCCCCSWLAKLLLATSRSTLKKHRIQTRSADQFVKFYPVNFEWIIDTWQIESIMTF